MQILVEVITWLELDYSWRVSSGLQYLVFGFSVSAEAASRRMWTLQKSASFITFAAKIYTHVGYCNPTATSVFYSASDVF